MLSLALLFILSLVILWLVAMYGVWKKNLKQNQQTVSLTQTLTPLYNKSNQTLRKSWFGFLRFVKLLRSVVSKTTLKILLFIFPKAKKAFEDKNSLTGLEHGPSSYFLMTISENKEKGSVVKNKIRRNKKNV